MKHSDQDLQSFHHYLSERDEDCIQLDRYMVANSALRDEDCIQLARYMVGNSALRDEDCIQLARYMVGNSALRDEDCIQLDRYMVGDSALRDKDCIQLDRYMVGNSVIRRYMSRAVKRHFRPCIERYTSPEELMVFPFKCTSMFFYCLNLCFISNWSIVCMSSNKIRTISGNISRIHCPKFLILSSRNWTIKKHAKLPSMQIVIVTQQSFSQSKNV